MCDGCGCGRFVRDWFLLCVLQQVVVPVCVVSMRFLKLWLQIALEWLHKCCMGYVLGGSRSTKPCVFSCKVVAGDDERYLVCATGAAAVVLCAIGSFYVFCWLFLCA